MKKILVYLFALTAFCSCDFETGLYTAIDMDKAFASTQDIENALNGAYSITGHHFYRGNRVAAIADMASDIALADVSKGHFVTINMWTFSDDASELLNVWESAYRVIDQSTRGINGALALLASGNLSDSDEAKLKSAVSQFHALRALAHFDLVNLFGLPYKAGGGNTQAGIVVIDKEPVKEFRQVERSTVEETYAHILDDIRSAKEYVTDELNQYYFNEAAIYALEARVNLYMHNYAAAKTAARKAIELRQSPGPDNKTYVSMWKSTAITDEDIFTLVKSEDDNLSANSLNTLYGLYGGSVSAFVKGKFKENDIRAALIDAENHPKKYDGIPTAANVGNVPVFRLSEMYLVAAEAEARLDNIGPAQAALLFTAKRDTGITGIADLPATREALLKFIEDERIREFFTEGHRLYDLRRTRAVATIAGDTQFVAANFVYPIPSEEINAGFGVTQNEGWSNNLPKP